MVLSMRQWVRAGIITGCMVLTPALAGAATVRVDLGATNREQGLRQVDHKPQHISRVVTKGGRECRATDLKHGDNYALDFDVDDAFLHRCDMPVKVTVEYYDEGHDWFRLRYDSTDITALDYGESKFSDAVQKTDSKTWKKVVFALPDACFAGRTPLGCDFQIDSCGAGDGDEYIGSVEVAKGGLRLFLTPDAVAAGNQGVVQVTAELFDSDGKAAADGTEVRFFCDSGQIDEMGKTKDGRVTVRYLSSGKPGHAVIRAQAGDELAQTDLVLLPGSGNIMEAKIRLGDLQRLGAWTLTHCTMTPHPGGAGNEPSSEIAYDFSHGITDTLAQHITIPGKLVQLDLDAKPDGSNNMVGCVLRDGTGRLCPLIIGILMKPRTGEWRTLRRFIGNGTRPEDIVRFTPQSMLPVRPPITFESLTLGLSFWLRPQVRQGTIAVKSLWATVLVPESEVPPSLPSLSVRDTASGAFVTLTNHDEEKRGFSLIYKLIGGDGKPLESGAFEPEQLCIAPSNSATVQVRFTQPHPPGIYTLRLVALNAANERLTYMTDHQIASAAAPPLRLTVKAVTGHAEVLHPQHRNWQEFTIEEPLAEHDLLRTSDDGGATVILPNGVEAMLHPNTTIEFRRVAEGGAAPRLVVWRGFIHCTVPDGHPALVMTRDRSLSTAGARFTVSYDSAAGTQVSVTRGSVTHVESGQTCPLGTTWQMPSRK